MNKGYPGERSERFALRKGLPPFFEGDERDEREINS